MAIDSPSKMGHLVIIYREYMRFPCTEYIPRSKMMRYHNCKSLKLPNNWDNAIDGQYLIICQLVTRKFNNILPQAVTEGTFIAVIKFFNRKTTLFPMDIPQNGKILKVLCLSALLFFKFNFHSCSSKTNTTIWRGLFLENTFFKNVKCLEESSGTNNVMPETQFQSESATVRNVTMAGATTRCHYRPL